MIRERLSTSDLHAQIGDEWPSLLARLGIDASFLRIKKAGPCPICGGTDRYTFDNRKGRGDYFCRSCGAGDGFTLLMRANRWEFAEAFRQVRLAVGLSESSPQPPRNDRPSPAVSNSAVAKPPARILSIVRGACPIADCADAVAYLRARSLWPLPEACRLRAHPAVEYWDGRLIGRFPALVGEVRDRSGDLVTAHVTYLSEGHKLSGHEPRKLLSPSTGREGCAIRLLPLGDSLGIAEGIETALSAAQIDRVPVWAAVNSALLAKFDPPDGVTTLRIYADRDTAGLHAAARLLERLQGRVRCELLTPPGGAKDFNDALCAKEQEGVHG